VIVFCTPVDRIAARVLEAAAVCRPGTLLTDAGSTKAELVAAVEAGLPAGVAFVGGHPLAGSEKSGPDHARADLFEGRLVILTPTSRTDPTALAQRGLLGGSGGEGADDDPGGTRPGAGADEPPAAPGGGGGGRRDAGGPPGVDGRRLPRHHPYRRCDPELWTAIFLQNRGAVLAALAHLGDRLAEFRKAIESADAAGLGHLFGASEKGRDALGN